MSAHPTAIPSLPAIPTASPSVSLPVAHLTAQFDERRKRQAAITSEGFNDWLAEFERQTAIADAEFAQFERQAAIRHAEFEKQLADFKRQNAITD